MKVKVEVSLLCRDLRVADAIGRSLQPDNVGLPEGLELEMRREGRRLTVAIYSEARIETLISTVDDLLESLQTSVETLTGLEAG